MEQAEQSWGFSPEQKAALVAAARAWPGTQREFAAEHGICQATVSKWLSADPTRRCEHCGTSMGGRRPHARFCTDGCRGTSNKTRERPQAAGIDALRAPPPARGLRPAPTMLEVVWTPASQTAPAPTPEPVKTGVRLMLGDGVGMVFDTLPPAAWVAQLAAELRRC